MNKSIFSIAVLIMMFSEPFPASAFSGLDFLSKSPIAYFTSEDSRLLKETLYDVLDNKLDGKTVKWVNKESGHFGKIKSTKTFTQKGCTCRTVMFFNSAGGVTGQGSFNFCKQNGVWKTP